MLSGKPSEPHLTSPVTNVQKAKKRSSDRDAAIRRQFEESKDGSPAPALSGNRTRPGSSAQLSRRSSIPRRPQSQQSISSPSHHRHQQQPLNPVSAPVLSVAPQPGSVASMQPAVPLVVHENMTVIEVARAMAGGRVDAVLVTDALPLNQQHASQQQQLKGILTDKDLAFRCVAAGLDAARTRAGQIMTPSPVHVSPQASVEDAIDLMLKGHFRHLPVVENGRSVGLLDITTILLHIQNKMQNSWGKADLLQNAFQEFQVCWQNVNVSDEVQQWFSACRSTMAEPALRQVMQHESGIPTVTLKTSVKECARVMKSLRQTAVLVMDSNQELAGIFTTKDICLRVLAPNDLDPRSTSVIRVMTPHPDCGVEDMTVREALKKMHDGHYLHLPVRQTSGGRVSGLVDVLTLTYHTMEELIAQQQQHALLPAAVDSTEGDEKIAGPMWSQFFESSLHPTAAAAAAGLVSSTNRSDSAPSVTGSQSCTTVVPPLVNGTGYVFKFRDPLTSSVHRFSCRVVANEQGESPLAELLELILSKCGCVSCEKGEVEFAEEEDSIREELVENQDDTHTLFAHCSTFEGSRLRSTQILESYQANRFLRAEPRPTATTTTPIPQYLFRVYYKDDEGDFIFLQSDADLMDAVGVARMMGWGRLVLRVEVWVEDEATGQPTLLHAAKGNQSIEDRLLETPEPQGFKDISLGMWIGVLGMAAGVLGLGVFVSRRLRNSS